MNDYGKVQEHLHREGRKLHVAAKKQRDTLASRIPKNGEGWKNDETVNPPYWDDAMELLGFEYQGAYEADKLGAGDHIWLLAFGGLEEALGIGIQVTGMTLFRVGISVDSPSEAFDGSYETVATNCDTPVEAAKLGLRAMRKHLSDALAQIPDPDTL